jgi:multicomponent Na+:H+ antiporter subunit D
VERPVAAVLVSLVAAGLIRLIGDRPAARETVTFVAAALKFAVVASMVPTVLAGGVFQATLIELVPGLSLALRTDALGLLFALLASALWVITSVYSVGYMRAGRYPNQTGYFASFAVCLSATIGLAFAANLLTFFIFYEILTLATYPLVAHNRDGAARAGGRKYLVYTLVAGQALLLAVVWSATLAPGAEFTPGGFLPADAGRATLLVLFALFIAGVGVKAAIMPLHGWLPAAMVAPTPVSALLHAVAVVKAGAFGVVRVVGYVFGVDLLRSIGAADVLAVAASVTILTGSIRALGETNLKRRLAYSTVSQLSYIVLGAALGSVAAVAGAIFHIAAHGFMKITLFFCAGALYAEKHKTEIDQVAGLSREMPVTMSAFAVGASGLAGIPLLAGFISKWNIGLGAIDADRPVFVFVLVASGLLNLAYFYPIIYDAFFGGTADRRSEVANDERPHAGGALDRPGAAGFFAEEARWSMSAPLAVTAILAILLGLMPDVGFGFYELAWTAASSITAGGAP